MCLQVSCGVSSRKLGRIASSSSCSPYASHRSGVCVAALYNPLYSNSSTLVLRFCACSHHQARKADGAFIRAPMPAKVPAPSRVSCECCSGKLSYCQAWRSARRRTQRLVAARRPSPSGWVLARPGRAASVHRCCVIIYPCFWRPQASATVRNRSQPFATVRNRPQPSVCGRRGLKVAVPMGKVAKTWLFWRVRRCGHVVLRGRRGTSWHSNMFHDVSKVVLCGRCNTFVTFSEDALHFSWQAQHFEDLRYHYAWQVQHFRRVVLRVFCESQCQRCAKWWQGANSVAGVAFCDMSWKLTEASHETSILQEVHKKTRGKTLILTLRSGKFEEASHEMLALMLQHVSSRVAGFFDVVAVSMGEAAKPQVVVSFCVAGVALRDIPTCFKTCQKSFCVAGAILLPRFQTMRRIFRGRRNTLKTSDVILRGRRSTLDVSCCVFLRIAMPALCEVVARCKFCGRGGFLSQVMKNDAGAHIDFEVGQHFTPHFTLYTPHFTLSTLHCTPHTLDFPLSTPHFTL